MKIKVLDHIGYVELVDKLGDDLTPVTLVYHLVVRVKVFRER